MSSRTPAEIAELMAPVCKALIAISQRARAFRLAPLHGSDASISYYPDSKRPWVAYQWRRNGESLTGSGQTPMEAVEALAAQVDAHDPALNWKTLGVDAPAAAGAGG